MGRCAPQQAFVMTHLNRSRQQQSESRMRIPPASIPTQQPDESGPADASPLELMAAAQTTHKESAVVLTTHAAHTATAATRPVTIKDVAAHASVSVATVSAVMNANKYVSPELEQRVRASIDTLGYMRNSMARGLKTQVSHAIELVIPDIANPFFTNISRGVEDVANAHHYALILGNTDEDPQKELNYIHLLHGKRADGMIIATTAQGHDIAPTWPLHQFPIVSIDRSLFHLGIDTVLVDNQHGARMAIEHLIQLGHRRIGIVTGVPGIAPTDERLAGYKEALETHGIAVDPALVDVSHPRVGGGEQGAWRLLTQTAERPTALFLMDGTMVIGALQAIAKLGLRCPDDVALVGFDDFVWASVMRPRLTVVAQPTYEIGHTAAQLLFERLEHPDREPREVRLHTELVIRESCGASLQ
jgi:LacI family transcriptional regulator